MGGDTLNIEIVGLVKDAKYSDVKDKIPPVFFIPYRQDSTVGSTQLLRAQRDGSGGGRCVRSRR